jgi:VanZ family protein
MGLWVVWFTVLWLLSSIPANRLMKMPLISSDKLQHIGYFLAGSVCFALWMRVRKMSPRLWWLVPLLAAVVGAIDEFHQSFTPNRTGNDVFDWLSDVIGGFLALPVTQIISNRWLKISESQM